jgi:zinc transporter ZupT
MSILIFSILFFPVLVGGLVIYFIKPGDKFMKMLTTFSGAFLLSLSFLHIIPEIYHESAGIYLGLFVLAGFFIQLLLEFITGGIEHGHNKDTLQHDMHKHTLNVIPLMIGLCIHAFLEGMPMAESFKNEELQTTLLAGIVIHKIPISVVLTGLLLRQYGKKPAIPVILLVLFAFASPAGAFVSNFLNNEFLENIQNFHAYILAIVIGIFLHISTTILFETVESHRFNFTKLLMIILGFGVTIIISFLM